MDYNNNTQIVNFIFSPDIPWKITDKVVEPIVSKDIWNNNVKNKNATIVMPGHFLEVLTSLMAVRILKDNGVNATTFITPAYYTDLLKFFSIKVNCGRKKEPIIKEYDRLMEPVNSYPVPIFLNGNDDIYFNLLNNYGGNRKDIKGKKFPMVDKPYWKQILCNTCSNYSNPIFPLINKEDLFKSKLDLFKDKGINSKYILLDNSNVFQKTSDNRKVNSKKFDQAEINDLANNFAKHKIKCVIMSNENKIYVNNMLVIPSWDNINSLQLLSLLLNAECIISSDQNICLSAALIGCKKIVYLDNPIKGWRFEDLPIVNKDNMWITPNFYSNDFVYNITTKEM